MQTTDTNILNYRNDGDFYFSYGIKAFKEKRFDKAEKWFLKSLEYKPDNPLYLSQISVLYTEIGQYQKANDWLQRVVDVHGKDYPDCYYLLANNYAHLGLFYEAQKYAHKYLEHSQDGDFKEEVNQLVEMLDYLSKEENIEDDFELEELDEIIIYQETAFYYLEHEKWDEALEILEEMMTFYPEYTSSKHEYAFALFQKGDCDEAIALEEAWFEQDETNLYSRMNLVYFYYKIGKKQAFMELLPTLNNVYPTLEQQKLKLAVTLARVGEYNQAFRRFKRVDSMQVANYMSYFYWYSKVLFENGKTQFGEKIWKKGLNKHPALESFTF
ncbi:tetratricopeptide repeat protein [Aquisalibacillus elongatus]|uniref:Uncharacterized protein n=1 Tax=Aquisalibacillus elongatus TaxID=485577 RepID=A0A3N5BGI7_9BACI|nr:hypothetical protein [Aquisalibacillus elongatus]RPF54390.1 hypothetical protein EDC24_1588 [Aquisalibacillus elongatus]